MGVEIGEDFFMDSVPFSLSRLLVSFSDFLVNTLSTSLLSFLSAQCGEALSSKFACGVLTGVVDNVSSSLGLPAAGEKELDAELNGETSSDEVES